MEQHSVGTSSEWEVTDCWECQGSGQVEECDDFDEDCETVDCPECDGRGQVEDYVELVVYPYFDWENTFIMEVK